MSLTPHLRLLVLHGRYQSASIFERKFTGQPTPVAATFNHELLFVDAPFVESPRVKLKHAKKKKTSIVMRSWWTGVDDISCQSLRASLDVVKDAVDEGEKNQTPIHGVIGFSQGAALAALLCTKHVSEFLDWAPQLAIFCSGYIPNVSKLPINDTQTSSLHHQILSGGFLTDVKSLHVYGDMDHVVHPSKSEHLLHQFQGPSIGLEHNGHAPPNLWRHNDIISWLDNEAHLYGESRSQQQSPLHTQATAQI